MSDYTPRVEQLKEAFLINQVSAAEVRGTYTGQTGLGAEAEFDRAIAKVKSEAWEEGYGIGGHDYMMAEDSGTGLSACRANPYRPTP